MVRFTTAPIEEAAPKPKSQSPSRRQQIREQYRDELESAVQNHRALAVEFDPDVDKPITIRNRLQRAANDLGYTDLKIRRRKNVIFAYLPSEVPRAG